MVAGPEIARITTEFEEQAIEQNNGSAHTGQHHHDQQPGVQAAFLRDVTALLKVLEEMGNPFLEQSQDLLVIDTSDITDPQVAETVRRIETLGEEQLVHKVCDRKARAVYNTYYTNTS